MDSNGTFLDAVEMTAGLYVKGEDINILEIIENRP
jgi:hypothetical protein